MGEKDIAISVDSTEVDEALKKVRKLHKHLKKVKKLAKELRDIDVVLTVSETEPKTISFNINGHEVFQSVVEGFREQCKKTGANPFAM